MPKSLEPDLIVVDILTLLTVAVVLAFPVPLLREVLGLIFIMFSPGYVLTATIFPAKNGPGKITRISLSLALSVALGVFVGLILGVTLGFTLNSILIVIAIFTLAASGLAWFLRAMNKRVERPAESFSSFFSAALRSFRSAGWVYRSLVLFLLCVILLGLGTVSYALARPLPSQSFSEFYLLGMNGKAEAYPRTLKIGEEGRVIVGIVNHQSQEAVYHVQVRVEDVVLYDLPGITVRPGRKWQEEVAFTLQEAGTDQRVDFLFFADESVQPELRYIWVNVTD